MKFQFHDFRLRYGFAISVYVACSSLIPTANGQLKLILAGEPGSPILDVMFSGSDVVTSRDYGSVIYGIAFELNEELFGPIFSDRPPFDIAGSATLSNITTNEQRQLTNVSLQHLVTGDRVAAQTDNAYSLHRGDVFEWSGGGTIDLTSRNATFDDLRLGSFEGQFVLPEGVGYTGIDGLLVITPEPQMMLMILMGCCLFIHRR